MSVVKIFTVGKPGLDRLADLAGQVERQCALHHQMHGVVAGALAGPVFLALLDRVADRGALLGSGEVDDRGGAAVNRSLADDLGPLGQCRGAIGSGQVPFAVHVWIDASGHDDLACCINDADAFGQRNAARSGDGCDHPISDENVVCANTLRRYHRVAANDQVDHESPPNARRLARPGHRRASAAFRQGG